jgi:hypothetical protein
MERRATRARVVTAAALVVVATERATAVVFGAK